MAVAGKNGKVVIGESATQKVVGIKNWSLELSLDTLETTALGDDWKNYIQKGGRRDVRVFTRTNNFELGGNYQWNIWN